MSATAKYIVWDWNGTLFDDTHIVLDSVNEILVSLQRLPIDLPTMRTHYSIPLVDFYRKIGLTDDEVGKIFFSGNVIHDYYEKRVHLAELRDGVADVLASLRDDGIHSGILSNHVVEPIREQLRRFAIEHYFTDVMAYDSRHQQFRDKTKADRLHDLISSRNLDPKNLVIIGDTPEETHIARSVGAVSVAITGGCLPQERLETENPDYLIHSLHDLKPILQERGFIA